jgi:peptidyl-prolyl cis-trans isomerase SurA
MDDRAFEAALAAEGVSLEQYKRSLSEQISIGRAVDVGVRSKVRLTGEEKKGPGGETYRIRQIFIGIPEGEEKAARDRAATAMEALKAGEDFAAVAQKYSEDPTAGTGGDLGFIEKEHLAKEFQEALTGLRPGDVSEPFVTEKGVHIIKLEEVRGAGEAVLEERFQRQYRQWLRGLREKSFIEIRL